MEKPKVVVIEYFYREGGTFKVYGLKCFSNKYNIPLNHIETIIYETAEVGINFLPEHWGFKNLSFDSYNREPKWHQVEQIFDAFMPGVAEEDISDWIKRFSKATVFN